MSEFSGNLSMAIQWNPCRLLICLLSLLSAMSVSTLAAEQPAGVKNDAWSMEIAAFGRLPVRFNGQVTTFEAVAPRVLTILSDRNYFVDADGKRQFAVRWLLDVIAKCDNAEKHKIVPIKNPRLLTILGFYKDPRARRFRAAGIIFGPPRFAIAEIRPKFRLIDGEAKRILQEVKFEDYNDYHNDIIKLHDQMSVFFSTATLQRFPDLPDFDEFKEVFRKLDQIDQYAMFRMVPHRETNGQWQTTLRAGMMLRANKILEKEPNPAAQSLQAIFEAYRNKKVDDFNRHLAAYRKWVETSGTTRSPVSFNVPKTWRESGVRIGTGNEMFNEVMANGKTVSAFDLGERNKPAIKAFVRHFTGKTASDVQIYNDWRIGAGLMPLSKSELAKTGTPITISGHKVFYTDITPPENIETLGKRVVGTIVRHENHTFIMTAGLPDVVTHHKRDFESFLTSLKFASDEDLNRWLPESQPLKLGTFHATAVALVPDGTRLWSFLLVEHGNGIKEHPQQMILEKLIRSITPRKGNPTTGIQWIDPTGWRRGESEAPTINYSFQKNSVTAYITINVIGDARNADRLPLINHFRIPLGLPAWQREQMKKASRELQVAGKTVKLIKFEAPPAIAPSK